MTDKVGNGAVSVEALKETDVPTVAEARALPHHVVITFADNHSLGGAKIDIVGVTPEQIMVAVYHMTRSANMETDRLMLQSARQRDEVTAVMREIQKGRH